MIVYYVDTCIFLNIWKREVGPDPRRPFWKGSEEFLKPHDDEIAISTVVMRELELKLQKEFLELRKGIETVPRLTPDEEIFRRARKIESTERFTLSFYDILHALLAREHSLVLVTRDEKLLAFCRRSGVAAARPEECRGR